MILWITSPRKSRHAGLVWIACAQGSGSGQIMPSKGTRTTLTYFYGGTVI